jgi:transcriptional regulator with XRE-family HTH domain
MNPKTATESDQTIGARITALRKAKGLSQTALGIAAGVTFQQIQKYETGINRVGAGRLQQIARCLEVPVSVLFEGSDDFPEKSEDFELLGMPGAVSLIKAFAEIDDAQLRLDVLALARSAARMSSPRVAEARD